MLWKASVPISEQIYKTSGPAIHIGRLFGVFPVSVNNKDKQTYLVWSPLYMCYSIAIGILLPIVSIRGILKDILGDRQESVKIKSNTDMYVVFCDATGPQLAVFFATVVSGYASAHFFDYLRYLNEVDLVIPITDLRSVRRTSIFMIIAVLTATSCISITDILMYYRINEKWCSKNVLKRYLPVYISYCVMMTSQYGFWHLGHSILNRLRRLNQELITEISEDETANKMLKDKNEINLKNSCEINQSIRVISDVFGTNKLSLNVLPKLNYKKSLAFGNRIRILTATYVKLCNSVDCLNNFMGVTNAVTIIDILCHFIETPFHLLTEINGPRKDLWYIAMMIAWCLFHLFRLLILVEPSYSCRIEVDKTKKLICKLLCSANNLEFQNQLEVFATILGHCKLEFSAGGLTTIDRSLVTALLSAVTTYLVILLQYQN